jgi:hypothetical protein
MSDQIQDADGLYYPYINIRDDTWLKTSLLYFPHIVRMVPANYETGATGLMRTLAATRGARDEPLLGSYTLRSLAADEAVDRLTFRLIEDAGRDQNFAQRFSRTAARVAYGHDELFQIHRGKAPQYFWDKLKNLGMMWQAPYRIPGTIDLDEEWASLHPLLGEAFMATVAIAVAKEKGMDIITETPGVHRATACREEDAVYELLIRQRSEEKKTIVGRIKDALASRASEVENPRAEMTLRLAHLVIVGNFDVSALQPHDLAEMSKNREALFDFRRYLGKRVSEIPVMTSETERERRLHAVAEEAIAEWRKNVPTFSKFARRFFGLGLLDKSERTMTDLAKSLIPGSLTGAALIPGAVTGTPVSVMANAGGSASLLGAPLIAAGPGLAVALAIYGIKTWQGLRGEEMSAPLRYLSLLKKQGATLLLAAPPNSEGDARTR